MTDLMESLQYNSMPPPSLGLAASLARRGSEVSPSKSSFQSSDASRIQTPSTSVPTTPIIATRPASPEKKPLYSAESDNFLSALATRERRVLELREELQKAELDLSRLKKQWAAQEAKKKRNETKNLEQLQPLKTSLPEHTTICDESPISAGRELDRRKTLSANTRSSQRKVFSGSRHTRTLSLLANSSAKADPMYTHRRDSLAANLSETADIVEPIPELDAVEKPSELGKYQNKTNDRDMIIETGKQLVGDFRQGFWTFVEDLKQVTVGDQSSPIGEHRQSPKFRNKSHNRTAEKNREAEAKGSTANAGDKQGTDRTGVNAEAGNSKEHSNISAERGVSTTSKDSNPRKEGLGISTDSDGEAWDSWDNKESLVDAPL